jgi:hypothetical protein
MQYHHSICWQHARLCWQQTCPKYCTCTVRIAPEVPATHVHGVVLCHLTVRYLTLTVPTITHAAPWSAGGKLELHGLQAFDAAVYCASLTAAERMQAAGGSTDMQEGQDPSSRSTATNAAEAADAPPGTPRCGHSTSEPRSARDRRRSSSGSDTLLGGGAGSSRSSSWGRASSSSGSSSSSGGGGSRASSDSGSSSMAGMQASAQPSSSSGGSRHELDRQQQQQQQQGSQRKDGTAAADGSAGDSARGVLVTSEGMVRMGVQGLWEVASRAWSWLSSKSNVH